MTYKTVIILIAKDLLLPLFFIPMRLFCWIIPKNPNQVSVGAWMGKRISDNPKAFSNYILQNQSNVKVVIITNNSSQISCYSKKNVEVYKKNSLQGYWAVARSKLLITTHSVKEDINFITVSPGNNVLQFWHGTPVKKLTNLGFINRIGSVNLKRFYTIINSIASIFIPKHSVIVAASDFGKKALEELFKENAKNVQLLGYPRNDILFDIQPSNKKDVVLYLPTYRNKYSSENGIEDLLDRLDLLLSNKDYNFVVKLHPAVMDQINISKYKNLYDFNSYFGLISTEEGMARADVMVSDYSGLIYDWFLTDRPILFFSYDLNTYQKFPGFYFDYKEGFPGPFADNPEELVSQIDSRNTWFTSKAYSKKYQKLRRFYNKNLDGNSSSRVYNYLVENNLIGKQ